jgi:Bacterial SH3 domain
LKPLFRRSGDQAEEFDQPEIHAQSQRPLPEHEQRMMFEASTHWGRGLAIILGMIATVIVFLVVLTVIPKPGSGNPLDALTSSNTISGTPTLVAASGATPPVGLATVGGVRGSPSPGSAGTPGPRWVAVAPRGANVRRAANTNNDPIGVLAPGRSTEIIGRSPDNAWMQIVWDNNQKAWVAQELLQITQGDANQIPIIR